LKYRILPWGGRLCLCPADDRYLQTLCRKRIFPDRRLENDQGGDLLALNWDRYHPLEGLPLLPLSTWTAFARDEINLWNRDGTLRHALASLMPRLDVRLRRFEHRASGGALTAEPFVSVRDL